MSTIPINQKAAGLASILDRKQEEILNEWVRSMTSSIRRSDLIKESELRGQCSKMLHAMQQGLQVGDSNFQSTAWESVRQILAEISRTRSQQGFSPSETATFVFH
jgi:rsbT co-antagonist protein RsbR